MGSNRGRWSVGSLMKFILYLAVNFASVRALVGTGRIQTDLWIFLIVLLISLNLLFFFLSRRHRGRSSGPFWEWFELAGWGMIGLVITFASPLSLLLIVPLDWLADRGRIGRNGSLTTFLYLFGAAVLYGLMPLAVATFAGLAASRYGREPVDGPASVDALAVAAEERDGGRSTLG